MIRFLTAGESHGQGLVVIVEGMPAGVPISEDFIGTQMARRQRGHGRGGRMKIEQDWAHVVSGIRHGRTLGSPIAMTIENKDWVNWTTVMSVDPCGGRSRPYYSHKAGSRRPARHHEVRL